MWLISDFTRTHTHTHALEYAKYKGNYFIDYTRNSIISLDQRQLLARESVQLEHNNPPIRFGFAIIKANVQHVICHCKRICKRVRGGNPKNYYVVNNSEIYRTVEKMVRWLKI